MKFITPSAHGALDYMAALALIAIPFILGFEGIALWLSVAGGTGLIMYSLITDYALSIAKVLPFNLHSIFDSMAAVAFIVAPFVLGFNGVEKIYYIVMGLGVVAVVAFTSKAQA